MPIQGSGQNENSVSLSFRLQETLTRLAEEGKITIPSSLEPDGSLVIKLQSPEVLRETTEVFVVNRKPVPDDPREAAKYKKFPAYKVKHKESEEKTDPTIQWLLEQVYGKDNLEIDRTDSTLRVSSPAAAQQAEGTDRYRMSLLYTEFHNALAATNSSRRR